MGSLGGCHLGWFFFLGQLLWFRLLEYLRRVAWDAVALGVFDRSGSFSGKGRVKLEEWLGVEVLGEQIEAGLRRRP